MNLTPENRWIVAAAALGAAVTAWWWYQTSTNMGLRGGKPRHVAPASIRGSVLDNSLGRTTPDHLLWFGPSMRPAGWVPHKVRYPHTPGYELERITYGAPMACAEQVPDSLKGWLFNPPAEEDY